MATPAIDPAALEPVHSLIPSHKIASFLLDFIDGILDKIGLGQDKVTEEVIYVALISVISIFIGMIIKRGILAATQKIVAVKNTDTGRELLKEKTLTKCSHIIPPLVFMALIPFAFTSDSSALTWIMRIVGIYTLITFGIGIAAIFSFIFNRFNKRENSKNLPLRGVLNVAKGIVWILIIIVAASILIGKSPGTLLAGLGALSAALMLIFKDTILGFVAGIQMSDNDMLHVGDWIVVPSTPANGTVIDVSLSTVKVQNFDNTVVMVPPYTLMSTSFQNYRPMSESGARRIMNNLTIDITTIQGTTEDLIESVEAKFPELKDFIEGQKAKKEFATHNGGLTPMNGSIETNLGLFRAYVCHYLLHSPLIAQDQQILVRLREATDSGIPLQIYCFTATSNWGEYEAIQSALMEHLAAVIGYFGGLAIYSSSSLTVEGRMATKAI